MKGGETNNILRDCSWLNRARAGDNRRSSPMPYRSCKSSVTPSAGHPEPGKWLSSSVNPEGNPCLNSQSILEARQSPLFCIRLSKSPILITTTDYSQFTPQLITLLSLTNKYCLYIQYYAMRRNVSFLLYSENVLSC